MLLLNLGTQAERVMISALASSADPKLARVEQDELEYLSSATLTKRKDFIDREEEARNAPNRVLYYRRNADNDRLIQVCTDKLQHNSRNVRALLIRAASYVKKGKLIMLTSGILCMGPVCFQFMTYAGSVHNPCQYSVMSCHEYR